MDETRAVLDCLLRDARESVADIARQTGLDEESVESVIGSLEESGAIRGYQAIVDWTEIDEDHVEALVECNVELDRQTGYAEIADRIAQPPEVRSLRLVSGDYDFALEVEADSMHAVSRLVSERVAPIPEVTKTVTHFVMETHKRGGVRFDDSEDDRLSVSP